MRIYSESGPRYSDRIDSCRFTSHLCDGAAAAARPTFSTYSPGSLLDREQVLLFVELRPSTFMSLDPLMCHEIPAKVEHVAEEGIESRRVERQHVLAAVDVGGPAQLAEGASTSAHRANQCARGCCQPNSRLWLAMLANSDRPRTATADPGRISVGTRSYEK